MESHPGLIGPPLNISFSDRSSAALCCEMDSRAEQGKAITWRWLWRWRDGSFTWVSSSQHKIQRFWGRGKRGNSKGEGVYRHGAQQSVGEGSGYKGAPRLIVLLGKRLEDLLIM